MTAKNDYIVVQAAPKKYALLKVSSVKNGVVSGVLEHGCHIEALRTVIDLKPQDVILNLGADPHAGTVYGIDVGRRHRGKKTLDSFGDIHFFYRPKREVWKNIETAFNGLRKRLKKVGLLHTLESANLLWELEPANKQKYSGLYARSRKETIPHRIAIRPEILDPSDYVYVLAHEFGHHIDFEFIQGVPALYTKWLTLYAHTVSSVSISRKEIQAHFDGLVKSRSTVMDYLKSLDEDDEAEKFKKILRIIRQVHRFSPADINHLLTGEDHEALKTIWPPQDIPTRTLDPVVSEYATTNVKELFAEAFAFYLTGKKLPKRVQKLIERSVTYASKATAG